MASLRRGARRQLESAAAQLIVGKQTHNWHTPPDFPCRNTSTQAVVSGLLRFRLLALVLSLTDIPSYLLARHRRLRAPLLLQPRLGRRGASEPDRLECGGDTAALHRLSTYYESLGDACGARTAAGAATCKATGCGWDAIVHTCRTYNLPDMSSDDPKACAAINKRGESWPTAAFPMENPYCSCKLTCVRSRCRRVLGPVGRLTDHICENVTCHNAKITCASGGLKFNYMPMWSHRRGSVHGPSCPAQNATRKRCT